jgi:four helix bundle protein
MARIYRFNFKRLDVYRGAVDHFAWTFEVMARIPTAPYVLRNQILGAALSIPANIAEANGRDKQPGEAEQHYRYAQGSIYESAAYLDSLAAMNVIDDDEYNQREQSLAGIAAMTSRLMHRQSARRTASRVIDRAPPKASAPHPDSS